jgi:GWxTD domain-containing protein
MFRNHLCGLLAFAACSLLLSVAKSGSTAKSDLSRPYRAWLDEDVRWIITDQERAGFQKLSTDAQRDQFVMAFWTRRDPTPGTPENEFKEEHYRRLAYANQHFAATIPGWKTDRGRVYIVYGPPDQIESHPSRAVREELLPTKDVTGSANPYEVWHYRHLKVIGQDVTVKFVDSCRCGDYRRKVEPSEKLDLP